MSTRDRLDRLEQASAGSEGEQDFCHGPYAHFWFPGSDRDDRQPNDAAPEVLCKTCGLPQVVLYDPVTEKPYARPQPRTGRLRSNDERPSDE